ncbi:unnamed protein product, partial [Allacma fusca]
LITHVSKFSKINLNGLVLHFQLRLSRMWIQV